MDIGRRIYYDVETGEKIVDTGEHSGSVVRTTVERDIELYKTLSERNRETFDVIELEYGQYSQDFAECTSYRINSVTRELEFSYDTIDDDSEPIYRAPLSVEVQELRLKTEQLEGSLDSLLTEVLPVLIGI